MRKKTNNKITEIPYSEVEFQFISNHYDIHLNGTCIYKNRLCEFETNNPHYNIEKDEFDDAIVNIYRLTIIEKLKWYYKKWLFETCVGFHYSYRNRQKIEKSFSYRKPTWLYKTLFRIYYSNKIKMKK